MNMAFTRTIALLVGLATSAVAAPPPGVVVDRSPDFQRVYVGCPSIAVLPDGSYVASHSWFGPGTSNDSSEVFGSTDRGATWHKRAALQGQWWSTLFVHRGALYILGVTGNVGDIVIRRSRDGGKTWSTPTDARSGRLFAGKYHCAPVSVIVHGGRIWRAFELAEGKRPEWSALVLSAAEDADLLDAAAWRMSEKLQHLWSNAQWIEGNMVVAPDGTLVDVLRTGGRADTAAIVHVSADGLRLTHDREADVVSLPGGGSKFTIRFDPQTKRYWCLGNKQTDPPAGRNVLALSSSADLRNWRVETTVLHHADRQHHAWQYVDWLFDGPDLIAVSRTAWDDAHNYHDANYLTFHRIENFRTLTPADAPPMLRQLVQAETADYVLSGSGWTLATLADGRQAFSNRPYAWQNVPPAYRDWQITQTAGGVAAEIRVKVKRPGTLFAATAPRQAGVDLAGWQAAPASTFAYTDTARTPMAVYGRAVRAGEELVIPQGNWTGLIVLLPPAKP